MSELPVDTPESAQRKLDAMRTPAEIDAGFERGDPYVGSAVIRLVFTCEEFDAVAERVERALRSDDRRTRGYGCVAAGDMTRVFGRLSPGIYGRLRELGLRDAAEDAIRDVLTFIPFRELPPWLRRLAVRVRVQDRVEGRWLAMQDLATRIGDLVRRSR